MFCSAPDRPELHISSCRVAAGLADSHATGEAAAAGQRDGNEGVLSVLLPAHPQAGLLPVWQTFARVLNAGLGLAGILSIMLSATKRLEEKQVLSYSIASQFVQCSVVCSAV